MNKHGIVLDVLLGIGSASLIGGLIIQGLGAFLIGLLGAAGGYVWHVYLKPKIDKLRKNKDKAV